MPISEGEWVSITRAIGLEVGRLIGRRRDYFILSEVIKHDELKMLVWIKELKDQPIPLLAFDYVTYSYDTQPDGTIKKKEAKMKLKCPKVGDIILVAREYGSDFMPRCLGVVHSKGYLTDLDDE
jgi:hypothetical protein